MNADTSLPTTKKEAAYARVLPHIERYREYVGKARSGSDSSRLMYRRMADRQEKMIGALIAIARATPDEP